MDQVPYPALALFRTTSTGPEQCQVRNNASLLGIIPDRTGSVPDRTGSIPDQTGSIPDRTGSIPDRTGSVPDSTGSIPDRTGTIPDHQNKKFRRSGIMPS